MTGSKESACQWRKCRRFWFDPWVRKIPWRRAWQPTPGFLPGKFHEQRILVGYSPRSWKESDMTNWAHATKVSILIVTANSLFYPSKVTFTVSKASKLAILGGHCSASYTTSGVDTLRWLPMSHTLVLPSGVGSTCDLLLIKRIWQKSYHVTPMITLHYLRLNLSRLEWGFFSALEEISCTFREGLWECHTPGD